MAEFRKSLSQQGFLRTQIPATPFLLTSYERISAPNKTVNLYIEGDGRAWLNKSTPSLDPTPKNPLALKLAALDPAQNVVYLARPCQFTKALNNKRCDQKYWTSQRFAPEVLTAMSKALSDIKQRHNIESFNLIGFSGGGNIAALLAAKRSDVVSLRTVAGNLNHALQSQIHNVSAMPHSLNALEIAHQISHITQLHFIGGKDKIVPQEIYQSFKRASGVPPCMRSKIVKNTGHIKGWEERWNVLLAMPLNCTDSYK